MAVTRFIISAGLAGLIAGAPVIASTLALDTAVRVALENDPDLNALAVEFRAAGAREQQAAVMPNPELELELEGFTDSGDGFKPEDTTVTVSQDIELGGKRAHRRRLAGLDRELIRWEMASRRLDLVRDVRIAFTDAVLTRELTRVSEQTSEFSGRLLDAAAQRVAAGKVSPLEESKADVEYYLSRLHLAAAHRAARIALSRLALLLNLPENSVETVSGDLTFTNELPDLETLMPLIQKNPDIRKWDTESAVRLESLEQERAAAVPNISLSLGYTRNRELNDGSYHAGLAIPLPVFDRNTGQIRNARLQKEKHRYHRDQAVTAVQAELYETYLRLATTHDQVRILNGKVLPAARYAMDAAEEGYLSGKYGFLDLLDTQRTWFDVTVEYLETLAEHARADAEMDRLTGRDVLEQGPGSLFVKETENE